MRADALRPTIPPTVRRLRRRRETALAAALAVGLVALAGAMVVLATALGRAA
jgi:hypothetical protein